MWDRLFSSLDSTPRHKMPSSGPCYFSFAPTSRHHRPAQPPAPVGVPPAPLQRDVVGSAPASIPRASQGVEGPTQCVGDRGSSAQRPGHQPASVRPDPTGPENPGPSRDAVLSPIDAVRQEDGEDGEVFDEESSLTDGEARDDPYASSSASQMVPEPEMVALWESSRPRPSTRPLAAINRRMKKWGSPSASAFTPPRQEPFLCGLFTAFKKSSKKAFDDASLLMASSGAAGHAVVHAAARMEALKAQLVAASVSPEEKEEAAPWVRSFTEVSAILADATAILSAHYAHGVAEVRKGVLAQAQPQMKTLLEDHAPADGFYFGNPQTQVQGAADFMVASSRLTQASRPAPRPPTQRQFPRRLPPVARSSDSSRTRTAPAPAASSSSSSSKGKAYGRPSRGGKGGQKKN